VILKHSSRFLSTAPVLCWWYNGVADKSGFVGAGTFQRDNRRSTYRNKINVKPLGLRLEDVRANRCRA
jgi:hypothetical protein